MPGYVALLRGITPMNPAMRNENLRAVCDEMGLTDVVTVISSGNIVFKTDTDPDELEDRLETAWSDQLGFGSTTIIRSRSQLEALLELNPFGKLRHSPRNYLLTTFSKKVLDHRFRLPYRPEGREYQVVAATDRELFTVSDTTRERTPDVMRWMEQQFGEEITSRTWLTVSRILKKMG